MPADADPRFAFSDLALARRLERAEGYSNAKFVEARAAVEPQIGAHWVEAGGAYAMYDGASSPLTQTFGLGLFEEASDVVLDQIEAFFRECGAPVYHEVSPMAGIPLAALLAKRGYKPVEFTSVMHRPMGNVATPGPAAGTAPGSPANTGILVRPIGEDEGEEWARVSAKGWSEFPEFIVFLESLGRVSVRREGAVSFLAEQQGQPIAAGTLCLHEGVALFGGACTIPEARRRGAQLALMDARLRYARECGCDLLMMCASPGSASQRNAERYGFRIAYTRTKWQLSPRPE